MINIFSENHCVAGGILYCIPLISPSHPAGSIQHQNTKPYLRSLYRVTGYMVSRGECYALFPTVKVLTALPKQDAVVICLDFALPSLWSNLYTLSCSSVAFVFAALPLNHRLPRRKGSSRIRVVSSLPFQLRKFARRSLVSPLSPPDDDLLILREVEEDSVGVPL